MLSSFLLLAETTGDVTDAGKAIALALGIGLGALGAGVGIGNIFGSMIQAVARQPELRGELHRALNVGEQHRDLFTLTFEGGLRLQDFIGEVLRGIDSRITVGVGRAVGNIVRSR